MRHKAIVFDRDGTLFQTFDSPMLFFHSVKDFLSEQGIKCPETGEFFILQRKSGNFFWKKLSGGRLKKRDYVEWKKKQFQKRKINPWLRPRFCDYFTESVKIYPEVKGVIKTLSAKGYRLALTSGSSCTEETKAILEMNGMGEDFASILTFDDYVKKVSNPIAERSVSKKMWLIENSMDCLGVEPSETVVVDDSNEGIMAGKKMGVTTIAVLSGVGSRYVKFFKKAKTDVIINSIGDLPKALDGL